jgi:hypothetical protein
MSSASTGFDGATFARSGNSLCAVAFPSSVGTAVRPSRGSSPEVRAVGGEGAGRDNGCVASDDGLSGVNSTTASCDTWSLLDSPASPMSRPSGVRAKRRGQDGSGCGLSSSSGDPSSGEARRSARSAGIPAGQAIGSDCSFQGACSPSGSSDAPAASPGWSIWTGSAIPAADSELPGCTSSESPALRPS